MATFSVSVVAGQSAGVPVVAAPASAPPVGVATAGSAPIWRSRPIPSNSDQTSAILPHAIRIMLMPVNVIVLPVGAIPPNSPVWVPSPRHRSTTRSPSVTANSTVYWEGKAVQVVWMRSAKEAVPSVSGPSAQWWTWSGLSSASMAAGSWGFQRSSYQRRAIASFSSSVVVGQSAGGVASWAVTPGVATAPNSVPSVNVSKTRTAAL